MASITANQYKEDGTLSGLTNGRPLKISATTQGTAITIHTSTSNANEIDFVTLYAENIDTSNDIPAYLIFGTETSGDETPYLIPKAQTTSGSTTFPAAPNKVCICDAIPLGGGEVVKVYAGTTNKIKISGYYKRYETVT